MRELIGPIICYTIELLIAVHCFVWPSTFLAEPHLLIMINT